MQRRRRTSRAPGPGRGLAAAGLRAATGPGAWRIDHLAGRRRDHLAPLARRRRGVTADGSPVLACTRAPRSREASAWPQVLYANGTDVVLVSELLPADVTAVRLVHHVETEALPTGVGRRRGGVSSGRTAAATSSRASRWTAIRPPIAGEAQHALHGRAAWAGVDSVSAGGAPVWRVDVVPVPAGPGPWRLRLRLATSPVFRERGWLVARLDTLRAAPPASAFPVAVERDAAGDRLHWQWPGAPAADGVRDPAQRGRRRAPGASSATAAPAATTSRSRRPAAGRRPAAAARGGADGARRHRLPPGGVDGGAGPRPAAARSASRGRIPRARRWSSRSRRRSMPRARAPDPRSRAAASSAAGRWPAAPTTSPGTAPTTRAGATPPASTRSSCGSTERPIPGRSPGCHDASVPTTRRTACLAPDPCSSPCWPGGRAAFVHDPFVADLRLGAFRDVADVTLEAGWPAGLLAPLTLDPGWVAAAVATLRRAGVVGRGRLRDASSPRCATRASARRGRRRGDRRRALRRARS